eukprot:Seg5647.2 transcript_id=Seg5647.2/GoldUCD/mRNA.D3Y31 product="Protein SpAN" protein_id=Seg5647.2/GoldUCD/D3Y31
MIHHGGEIEVSYHLKFIVFILLVFFTFRGSSLGAEDKKGTEKDEKDCAMATEICGLTKEEEQKLKDNAKLEEDDDSAGIRYPEEENDGMFEGDIKLTPEQKKDVEKQQKRQWLGGIAEKRMVALRPRAQHWPIGQSIPYELDATLSRSGRRAINAAIQYIQTYTCVQFHEKQNTDQDYINFFRGVGCWSELGYQGGMQQLSIGPNCDTKGTVLHEILHALGFGHEHSRPDRDTFVRIYLHRILSGKEHNFEKWTGQNELYGTVYDYNSVMHYPSGAFGRRGKKTISVLGSRCTRFRFFFRSLGNRSGLSASDIYQVNRLFQCPQNVGPAQVAPARFSKRFVKTNAGSSDNSATPEYTCKPYKKAG